MILQMTFAFLLMQHAFTCNICKFMWISHVVINSMINTKDFYADVFAEVTLNVKAVDQFAYSNCILIGLTRVL